MYVRMPVVYIQTWTPRQLLSAHDTSVLVIPEYMWCMHGYTIPAETAVNCMSCLGYIASCCVFDATFTDVYVLTSPAHMWYDSAVHEANTNEDPVHPEKTKRVRHAHTHTHTPMSKPQ